MITVIVLNLRAPKGSREFLGHVTKTGTCYTMDLVLVTSDRTAGR